MFSLFCSLRLIHNKKGNLSMKSIKSMRTITKMLILSCVVAFVSSLLLSYAYNEVFGENSKMAIHSGKTILEQNHELRENAEEIAELTVELQNKETLLVEKEQLVSEKNSTIQTLTSEREGLIWQLKHEGFEDK